MPDYLSTTAAACETSGSERPRGKRGFSQELRATRQLARCVIFSSRREKDPAQTIPIHEERQENRDAGGHPVARPSLQRSAQKARNWSRRRRRRKPGHGEEHESDRE